MYRTEVAQSHSLLPSRRLVLLSSYHAMTQADRYAGVRLPDQFPRIETAAIIQSP